MKYSLLNFIFCPFCRGELTCLASEEIKIEDNNAYRDDCEHRKSAGIGQVPRYKKKTGLAKILTKYSHSPGMDRNVDIVKGLLICDGCGHWYPLSNFVPELLPDHLRDWEKDINFLSEISEDLPGKLHKKLLKKAKCFQKQENKVFDDALAYKKAEMSIKEKIADENFFGPGYSSPFNKDNPEFTENLIKRFSLVLPFLELEKNNIVLDVGSGYSWTTEWLSKMGFEAIGVDICRTYIDIGIERMGKYRPHLIIADIENLPIKEICLNSVLCYDSFHHIPDRKKAMAHFYRSLKKDGLVVLAEPGAEHEHAQVSIDVVEKYGILERGLEADDVKAYCEGLDFIPPEQYFILKIQSGEKGKVLTSKFIKSHSFVECNIFVMRKKPEREDAACSK